MLLAQKFDYPETEQELRDTLDNLYKSTIDALNRNEKPRFKGLVEIMSAEATIVTAIHN
jgi:hypothetical protein